MTLPNKLTLTRIAIIPAMVIVASIPYLNENKMFLEVSLANFINLILFFIASVTDYFDGHLARKHNEVTTFGKFADPLADKMLVLTSFLILLSNGNGTVTDYIPMWVVSIILVRELMVSGIRLVSAQKGIVMAAGWSGKVKTATTMIALLFLFLYGMCDVTNVIAIVLMYISLALTIYSGIVILYNSRKVLFESI